MTEKNLFEQSINWDSGHEEILSQIKNNIEIYVTENYVVKRNKSKEKCVDIFPADVDSDTTRNRIACVFPKKEDKAFDVLVKIDAFNRLKLRENDLPQDIDDRPQTAKSTRKFQKVDYDTMMRIIKGFIL